MAHKRKEQFLKRSREEKRGKVAAAVHQAVCEFSGTDGFGLCMPYAITGFLLSQRVFGGTYFPQAGMMRLFPDPVDRPDYEFAFDTTDCGMERGEFHCWFAKAPGEAVPGTMEVAVEIADLSARHYRAMVERMPSVESSQRIAGGGQIVYLASPGDRLSWRRPEVPFVWTDGGKQHEWVKFRPDLQSMEIMNEKFKSHAEDYKQLYRLAIGHYDGV